MTLNQGGSVQCGVYASGLPGFLPADETATDWLSMWNLSRRSGAVFGSGRTKAQFNAGGGGRGGGGGGGRGGGGADSEERLYSRTVR